MKNFKHISLISALLLLAITAQSLSAADLFGKRKADQQNYITIKGKVVDAENGTPLVFATVAVKESNVAIVTNIDGEFTLKIGEPVTAKNLEVSFLGYKNKTIPLSDMRDNGYKNVISLETAPIPIKEIVVKPLDPIDIVEKAIGRIGKITHQNQTL
ncbi:MAG: carboxypeptidase-like regulatory domain-containing protein [Bacteroidales bacterium]|nr:carboxypeptidase-like regulatory domain-containing protein [Bacteroidales bacterium]